MAVHVRGGVGHQRYDTEELVRIEQRLDDVRRGGDHARGALEAIRHDVDLDADLAPTAARLVHGAIDEAVHGPVGLEHLRSEVDELHIALRYARLTYEEAEAAATAHAAVPSAISYFAALLDPLHLPSTLGSTLGAALLVGRLPVRPPSTTFGRIGAAASELLNWAIGDDTLPPDAIALDRAVRELGEGGQHILPWFLLPGTWTYDGRRFDVEQLTRAQRLLVPVVTGWHLVSGRRPRGAPDAALDVLAVEPPHPVPVTTDLPTTVAALHAIHIGDDDVEPGSIQLRRADHPDGSRSWVLLLPSTQALGLGGRNPVDNLTNFETYAGAVSDVEIGAIRAMELAGVAPGEAIAVVGFSQGGLTAMRLAADPLVRSRYDIRAVVTAGSPVGHLPTPAETEVLNLEHMEDVVVGLDGTSNPAELHRTTVSRALTTGEHGALDFRVPLTTAHSIDAYAQTAALALASGDPSVGHLDARLAEITGRPGTPVTATTYRLERAG
ncbi:hypothetical protein [Georgenia sunbinii]|uniref:hypothetical protein n=1 Tax=Georgenia sunbinii TaxID=3117728 RepID=UPI002F263D6D